MTAPLVAIVGRPNVGKSTLFNRLVGGRPALVHDTPGLTRDRRYGEFEYFGHHVRIVDTGGLDLHANVDAIGAGIHRQAVAALAECRAAIFVVDVTAGPTAADYDLADMLRKAKLPVICAANKADSPKRELLMGEIYSLALGDVFPVSAEHGRGVDAMVDALTQLLARDAAVVPEQVESQDRLRVAFVGKPNAGKSSLLNRLVGTERTLVHDVPGTTTDPIDVPFALGKRRYLLVDTAGVRRRARIDQGIERLAVSFSLGQLRRANVVVLVIDGVLGASEQDARLAAAIEQSGRGIVLALNKCDLLSAAALQTAKADLEHTFRFVGYAPMVTLSALRGDGVNRVMDVVDRVAVNHARRISTGEVNRFFAAVTERRPPPLHKGRPVRIHYLTQVRANPPTFVLWTNRVDGVAPSYQRFLVNQLRSHYDFEGTPLRLSLKKRVQRDENKRSQN